MVVDQNASSVNRTKSASGGKLFSNVKTMGRLDVVKDNRGYEVVVEARVDNEQLQKQKEIIDLLIAAGYFRARIQGLSPFDQVVGGIVWCITICNFNVDVDILFQENANVGEKINLVEKIVSVLPKMKCPYSIQPHEIQGFNYIAMFPVIQWLVKKVLIYRAEQGDQNRSQSLFNFSKNCNIPLSAEKHVSEIAAKSNGENVRRLNVPARKFKRSTNKKLKSDQALIQCTLLEFGKKADILQLISEGESNNSSSSGQNSSKAAASTVDEMMGSMTLSSQKGASSNNSNSGNSQLKISSQTVGCLLSEKVDQVAQLQAQFELKKLQAENSPAQQHARQVSNLQNIISESEKMLISKAEVYKNLNQKSKSIKGELGVLQQKVADVDDKLEELRALETDENKIVLEKLQTLIKKHDEVKSAESAFKAQCKSQMEQLSNEVSKLRNEIALIESNDSQNVPQEMKEVHEDLKNRCGKAEALIGRKMREIGDYERQLDDMPSRPELSQYQKRFVELYNQICFKYTETKHHFNLYNTLSDSKLYMEKEIGLLNSIHDGYMAAMKSNNDYKKQFLAHMEQVAESTGLTKDKVLQTKSGAKKTRDELNAQMMDLLDKQRQYYQIVRELQQEFNV